MKTEDSDRLENKSENRPVAAQTPEVSDSKRSEFEQLGDERELSLVGEFWVFIKENKAWWMVPILLVLGGLGILVMLSSTGAAPFIYTLF